MFTVEVIVNSDGTSSWYKKGDVLVVKQSKLFKGVYEVIEPNEQETKTIPMSYVRVAI